MDQPLDMPNRRRFQFGLRSLLLAIAACAVAAVFWREHSSKTVLEGTWRGGARHSKLEMIVHRDQVIFTNQVGSKASHFRLDNHNRAIEIYRDDGIQHGNYKLTDDHLELRLANMGRPRPQFVYRPTPDANSQYYIFEREP